MLRFPLSRLTYSTTGRNLHRAMKPNAGEPRNGFLSASGRTSLSERPQGCCHRPKRKPRGSVPALSERPEGAQENSGRISILGNPNGVQENSQGQASLRAPPLV